MCRIDSRGHVNRFLRRFSSIDGDWPVARRRGGRRRQGRRRAHERRPTRRLAAGALGYGATRGRAARRGRAAVGGRHRPRRNSTRSADQLNAPRPCRRWRGSSRRSGCRRRRAARTARRRPSRWRARARSRARCRCRTVRPGTVRDGVEPLEHALEVAGAMPGPSSSTCRATSRRLDARRRPPLDVAYFRAFSTRLATICASRSGRRRGHRGTRRRA